MRIIVMMLAAGIAAPALAAPTTMATALTGAAEVPGPGAPDGKGMATITVDPAAGQLCFDLTASGTDTPTMAHVHQGAAGVAGPVVVALDPPANGMAKGCKPVAADVAKAILAMPADYYVNVHTAAYPKGAMRGQLGR